MRIQKKLHSVLTLVTSDMHNCPHGARWSHRSTERVYEKCSNTLIVLSFFLIHCTSAGIRRSKYKTTKAIGQAKKHCITLSREKSAYLELSKSCLWDKVLQEDTSQAK
jgi:hypothetical protein